MPGRGDGWGHGSAEPHRPCNRVPQRSAPLPRRLVGQQPVAVDHRCGEVDEPSIFRARLLAQHLEGAGLVDRVTFHQDALCPLDQRTPSKRTLELVILGKAAQHDVYRALPIIDVGVADVREDASLRGRLDEGWIAGVQLSIFKGFGHGINKPKANRALMQQNLDWFTRYLWNQPTTSLQ